jgi:predicted nucleic acid-binding protein
LRGLNSYAYLDTNYLIAYLAHRYQEFFRGLYVDSDQRREANSVVTRLTSKRIGIRVQIFVLAELVTQLKEKGINVGIGVLYSNFELAMLRRENINKFIKALRILAKDPMLEEMDSIIVAHAMSSSECKYFLTFDRKLINNKIINEANRKLNEGNGLVITPYPFSK